MIDPIRLAMIKACRGKYLRAADVLKHSFRTDGSVEHTLVLHDLSAYIGERVAQADRIIARMYRTSADPTAARLAEQAARREDEAVNAARKRALEAVCDAGTGRQPRQPRPATVVPLRAPGRPAPPSAPALTLGEQP